MFYILLGYNGGLIMRYKIFDVMPEIFFISFFVNRQNIAINGPKSLVHCYQKQNNEICHNTKKQEILPIICHMTTKYNQNGDPHRLKSIPVRRKESECLISWVIKNHIIY